MQKVLITGGAGFIGSALCRRLCSNPEYRVKTLKSGKTAIHKKSALKTAAPALLGK